MVSKPDIAYAVNTVSQYAEKLTKEHWNAVKRIIKYIKRTVDYGIKFEKNQNLEVRVYSNADFAGDKAARKSTTGYVILLGKTPIAWGTQKQRSVALSTTESEYVATSQTAKELIWIKKLVKDLLEIDTNKPVMLIDNQSAIKLIKNPEYHKRTKRRY